MVIGECMRHRCSHPIRTLVLAWLTWSVATRRENFLIHVGSALKKKLIMTDSDQRRNSDPVIWNDRQMPLSALQ